MSQKTGQLSTIKALYCKICNKTCYNIHSLRSHLLAHQKEGVNLCIYCQSTSFENNRHRIEHEITCRIVNYQQPQIRVRRRKALASKLLPLKPFPKIKPKQLPLVEHEAKSSDGKDLSSISPVVEYQCEHCVEVFTNQDQLREHLQQAHSAKELFPCHLCGLTYETQQSMKRHLKMTHEGKRNVYPCLMCRKKGHKRVFSTRSMLEKPPYG